MMVRPSTSTATIRNTERRGPENRMLHHATGLPAGGALPRGTPLAIRPRRGTQAMRYTGLIAGIALGIAGAVVGAQSADQPFVTKLAGVGMAEVEIGTLAKDKASSREVKAFAQRMIDEHTKAGNELKAI